MKVAGVINQKRLGLAPFIYHNNRPHFPEAAEVVDRLAIQVAYTLIQVSDGTLLLQRNGQTERCVAGDLVLTQPGDHVRVTIGTRLHLIAFDLFLRKRQYTRKKSSPAADIPKDAEPAPLLYDVFKTELVPRIDKNFAASGIELLNSCADNYWRNGLTHAESSLRVAMWLLRYVRFLNDESDRQKNDNIVEQVEEIIRIRLADGVRVADIAHTLGMSRSYFSQIYSRTAGIGPGEAIENFQLDRAKRLLADTQLPTATIADRLGFTSASAFGRFFKRHLQHSPTGWRKEYLQQRNDETL